MTTPQTPSEPGVPLTFLVATPHLRGTLFEGAVILLLEHDQSGALGLIVNAPTSADAAELVPALGEHTGSVAWLGGPVEPEGGWCLYPEAVGLPGELRLCPGLYASSDLEVLCAVARAGQPFMLVMGYAGWAAGQLVAEAREGVWLWVEQEDARLLWDVPAKDRWQQAIAALGVDPGRLVAGGAQA
ncbi:YqgE/AlgH family protein [Deinococcus lacus]|uniref:YqgE/AlgH family protein n=1 Tax=Deinococcus lacus TaxID=392561 RepID=A0ABW1YDM6_9DEIO